VRAAAVALGAALACAGCGAAPTGMWSGIYAKLFPIETRAQCNFCHSNPPNEIGNGKLSMGADKAAAYAALVGKASTGTKCADKQLQLVVPGKPEESLFYLKFQNPPPCGDRMPQGGGVLSGDDLEMVRSWIAAGAPDD
jgi:hypothetical protein